MNYVSNLGLAIATLSLIGLGAAGLGYRGGCWSYKTGIGIVKKSGLTSLAAVVVCLIGLGLWYGDVVHEGLWSALTGLILGGCVLAITMNWKRNLDCVPYIHDITTDTENPPQFVNVLPLRANAENSAVYGGPEIARQQQTAYPDLKPIALSRTPQETFDRALQVAQDMGWRIVDSSPQLLRIEATDTTRWFGFQDDVVVRITSVPTGSRVDVRSVSRVGKSDLGTNARRIEAYLSRMV